MFKIESIDAYLVNLSDGKGDRLLTKNQVQTLIDDRFSKNEHRWLLFDSIIIDTIEGFSSFMWTPLHNPAYGKESEFWYLPADVKSGPKDFEFAFWLEDKEEPGKEYLLTPTLLAAGYNDWCSWRIERDEPILYPGCSEWDCVCADEVVQFAVFGELVYG